MELACYEIRSYVQMFQLPAALYTFSFSMFKKTMMKNNLISIRMG